MAVRFDGAPKRIDSSRMPKGVQPTVDAPRRCTKCFYVLDHLGTQGHCPECGTWFDIENPATFTCRPPYIWWTYWLPGLIASVVFGFIGYLSMIWLFGYAWSSVVGVPIAAGVIFGYSVNTRILPKFILILSAVIGIIVLMMSANLLGMLCAMTMTIVALLPFIIGAAVGEVLRRRLKKSRFSLREYLPLFLAAVVLICGVIEGRHPHLAIVSTRTLAVIDATPAETWNAIQFYEQVKHRPPLLLWLTPCLRPAYTLGQSEKVGDIKVCIYERGRLTKQITEVIPGRRLAFRIIEQKEIETDGVRLVDGSFDLTPATDGKSTAVTLTTRYEPLLTPRFAFLPTENLAVHTLHQHVLLGMKEDAEARDR